jgi:hypothetical protein
MRATFRGIGTLRRLVSKLDAMKAACLITVLR